MLPLAIKTESARFLKVRLRATEEEGVAVERKVVVVVLVIL
jgi:hypothetical protein